MSIDQLHRICALKKLAEVVALIPDHEMVVTIDRYDIFGEPKTGEEIANESALPAL